MGGGTRLFLTLRNCRFDSTDAISNPQSQQMIILVCIADSPTHIHGQVQTAQRESGAKIRKRNWKRTKQNPRMPPYVNIHELEMVGAMWISTRGLIRGLYRGILQTRWLLNNMSMANNKERVSFSRPHRTAVKKIHQ